MIFGRGQTSLEFLYTLVFMLIFFSFTVVIYALSQDDLVSFTVWSESNSICQSAAGQISTIASAGEGASATLALPRTTNSYVLRINAAERAASVSLGNATRACRLSTSLVTNGTSGNFTLADGALLHNTNGGVRIG